MNQNKSARKRQQLTATVHQDMECVQEAVDHISYLRNSLDEKSQKLKFEIRSSFSSIFEQLHSREEQLLRQVDVLTNSQRTSLSTQIAKMYYIMGRLKSSLETLGNEETDFNKLNIPVNDLESAKKVQLQSLPSYSLHLDTNQLENTIQEFGSLDVLRTLLNFPPPEGSRSLPSSVEDYEMENEDHHVMHKTLLDQNSVKIRPPFKYEPFNTSTNEWLRNFDAECEEFSNLHDLNASESDSGSIAIINQSRSMSPYEIVADPLSNKSTSCEWISDINNKKDHKFNCNIDSYDTYCNGLKLDENSNKWLISKCTASPEDFIAEVEDICKANEKCESFCDCLCDQNCAVQWLRTKNSNEVKNNTSMLLEPMMKILYGKTEDYLSSSNKREEKEFQNLQSADTKNWLWEGKSIKIDGGEPINKINKQINDMFKPYFVSDTIDWLYH